jgi:hypothetical protein
MWQTRRSARELHTMRGRASRDDPVADAAVPRIDNGDEDERTPIETAGGRH